VIPYGKQNITDEDINAVINALRSDYLTQGPRIKEFEEAFAEYVSARYAVAVSNGTAALHLAAIALSVEPGCNVITSPITFVASANCIKYCGGNVYFADINPSTFTLDVRAVEELIKSKPAGFFKGIIPVDLAGYPVNLAEFRKLADEHGLWIIEDACHAPGGFVVDDRGERQYCGNGNYADVSVFSFHPVKHITTGEGGMITTSDVNLHKKLISLRTHGITREHAMLKENHGGWYYEMQELGYNYRLTDFQAALGITQLMKAKNGLQRRREIAKKYASEFAEVNGILAHSGVVEGHAYHLYVIRTNRRNELYEYLRELNIYCQIHYIPVHLMPYYRHFGYQYGDFPNAEAYYSQCLSLPMYPTMEDRDLDYVINAVLTFFQDQ